MRLYSHIHGPDVEHVGQGTGLTATQQALRVRSGAPKGIRTPDLHLERVAS